MNILLIFFALPIATIIISIALQKIFKCPILVAAIIFAIFLIVTFILNDLTFLVATIVYTIISFITAVIVSLICRLLHNERRNNECIFCRQRDCNKNRCGCNNSENLNDLLTISSSCRNNNNGNLLTISSNGCNGTYNDLLTINTLNSNASNNNCNNGCSCRCNSNNSANGISARINVISNSNDNSGCISGSYKRR